MQLWSKCKQLYGALVLLPVRLLDSRPWVNSQSPCSIRASYPFKRSYFTSLTMPPIAGHFSQYDNPYRLLITAFPYYFMVATPELWANLHLSFYHLQQQATKFRVKGWEHTRKSEATHFVNGLCWEIAQCSELETMAVLSESSTNLPASFLPQYSGKHKNTPAGAIAHTHTFSF